MNTQAVLRPAQVGIKMIHIAPGNFVFRKVRGVRCNGFELAETPFTNAHFLTLLQQHADGLRQVILNPEKVLKESMNKAAVREEALKCPLVFVNHTEAAGIAGLIGCRLPTELEWERAMAGVNERWFSWGDEDPDPLRAVFNDKGTRAVDRLQNGRSEDGFYDLVGNVWEWTSTFWGEKVLTDPQNPIFPQSGTYRILCGGSWKFSSPIILRGVRGNLRPEKSADDIGFRVAEDK